MNRDSSLSAPRDTPPALLSIRAAAQYLDATTAEVMDASTITLGEAQDVAIAAGLDPHMDYLRVPIVPEDALDQIMGRILDERAELAALDRFQVTIDTGNAAFDGDGMATELARILRTVADALEDGHTSGVARDHNGNTVGRWAL
ncbi:hypothetical protein ACLBYD_07655 [Rhodococcus sp. C26F]